MTRVSRRPRPAHAAQTSLSSALLTSARRGRHARLLPGRLPVALIAAMGGGMALLSVEPPLVGAQEPAATVIAQQATPPVPLIDLRESHQQHASRSRTMPPPPPPPSPVEVEVPPVTQAPVPAPAPTLPGCDGRKPDLGGYSNGRLPEQTLCALPGDSGEKLRADAAVDFVRLADAYQQEMGTPICVTDGYRTLAEQKTLRRIKPRLAARPGYSNHGWGQALDLSCGIQSFRSASHAWMMDNASAFGWVLPDWARRTGSRPEPWHWEYLGG